MEHRRGEMAERYSKYVLCSVGMLCERSSGLQWGVTPRVRRHVRLARDDFDLVRASPARG